MSVKLHLITYILAVYLCYTIFILQIELPLLILPLLIKGGFLEFSTYPSELNNFINFVILIVNGRRQPINVLLIVSWCFRENKQTTVYIQDHLSMNSYGFRVRDMVFNATFDNILVIS
jgi:hypothetical protein